MNERIKQLAERADWFKPSELPSNWDDEDYIVSPEGMEKFAELIVRECADVAEVWYSDYPKDSRLVSEAVKEHFGVE